MKKVTIKQEEYGPYWVADVEVILDSGFENIYRRTFSCKAYAEEFRDELLEKWGVINTPCINRTPGETW